MNFQANRVRNRAFLGALLLTTSGCQLSIDPSLVEDAATSQDASPSCPDGLDSGPRPGPDGWVDGSVPQRDGGEPDAVVSDPEAGPVLPPPCASDSDCAADTYCSVKTVCVASCDELHGCVVPNTGRLIVNTLLADQQAVYLSTSPHFDSQGNRLDNAAIWRMSENGTLTSVLPDMTSQAGIALLVDGQLYYGTGGNRLWRVGLTPGSTPVEVVMPGTKWLSPVTVSDSFIWFTGAREDSPEGSSLTEFYRAPRATGGPIALVPETPTFYSLAAATDDRLVLSKKPLYPVAFVHSVTGGADTQLEVRAVEGAMRGQRFVGTADGTVASANLDSSGFKTLAVLASDFHVYPKIQVTGDWVLWAGLEFSESIAPRVVLGRSHVAGVVSTPRIAELRLALPLDVNDKPQLVLSPWQNELIYYFPEEERLYRRTLPAFPCSAGTACPSGMACQPDQTCRRTN